MSKTHYHTKAKRLAQRALERNASLSVPASAGFSPPVVRRLAAVTSIPVLHINIYGVFSVGFGEAEAMATLAFHSPGRDDEGDHSHPDAPIIMNVAANENDALYRSYVFADTVGQATDNPLFGSAGYSGTAIAFSQFPVVDTQTAPCQETVHALLEIGHWNWTTQGNPPKDEISRHSGIFGPRFSEKLASLSQDALLAVYAKWHACIQPHDSPLAFNNMGSEKVALLCTTAELLRELMEFPVDPEAVWSTLLLTDFPDVRADAQKCTDLARMLRFMNAGTLPWEKAPDEVAAAARRVGIALGPHTEQRLQQATLHCLGLPTTL